MGLDGGCDRSASLDGVDVDKVAVTPTAQMKQNDRSPNNVTVRRGGPGGIVSRVELFSC